ncbi:MAG TPA: hypothetical protein VFC44_13750, partial [Candidatus Saccharimonadales bacterium]|nr:hypothetical protein [Candidatus Saccharimonadales bacterium]
KMKSLLPQCFVPVRYAHLHCALGEEDNQQQQSTTMFKVPNLFQDLTITPKMTDGKFSMTIFQSSNAKVLARDTPKPKK